MGRMTATEAARTFSELLNRVSAGEEIHVVRNGAEVALITPPTERTISAERFREVIATAPPPDPELAEDVRRARASVPPPRSSWPS